MLVVRYVVDTDPGLDSNPREFSSAVRPLVFYRNNGDGTFADVTMLLGDITEYPSRVKGAGFTPCFVDYDSDGDQDIYVVNDFGEENYPNVLWRNDGPEGAESWKFTDVSQVSRADLEMYGMGVAVGDYDNDGDFDFYMSNMGDSQFLNNQGDGTFVDVTGQTGTGRGTLPGDLLVDMSFGWGVTFADLDNDGYLDLYYVAGQMDSDLFVNALRQPNAVFLNTRDGAFRDVSGESGADHTGVGREVMQADFNGDGLLDLLVTNLGRLDGTPGTLILLENRSEGDNHWLAIKAVGTKSNHDAIGARIRLTANGLTLTREVGACEGHISDSVVPVHFGLGSATQVDSIEIRWPSGRTQSLTTIAVDQLLTVTEP